MDSDKFESGASETDADPKLTEKEYLDSIKWKVGELKDLSGAAKKKGKGKWEMIKRLWTGFFFMSMYINSYLISTFTMALMPFYLMLTT